MNRYKLNIIPYTQLSETVATVRGEVEQSDTYKKLKNDQK